VLENTGRLDETQGERMAVRARPRIGWRAPLIAGALAIALAAALYAVDRDRSSVAPAARTHTVTSRGLASLPLGAQGPASNAVAANDPAYAIRGQAFGLHAQNPAQSLSLAFTGTGAHVRAGSTCVVLGVSELGYGSKLQALAAGAPRADRNQVLYERPGVSESYANGPLGLEQSFTLTHAPTGQASQPLTVAIALGGNAHAALSAGAVAFSHAGGPTLRYDGLRATDAHGHLLHSWIALDDSRLLLHVQTRGATYPLRIDPFVQQAQLPVGNSSSVALSENGQTALVGVKTEGGTHSGAVYVFTRSGETWTQQGEKLTPDDATGEAQFGASVALSSDGDTAAIGGPDNRKGQGGVWVFTRTGETWTQQGEVLTESVTGKFGSAVAIAGDGDTILAGAPASAGTSEGDLDAGSAWVFTRSGETWSLQTKLLPDDEDGAGRFGDSVALSEDGNTALVGGEDVDNRAGAAWIFTRSGETWTQQQTFTGGGEERFGTSVALSRDGDTALVGGPGSPIAVKYESFPGVAWVFTRAGETWTSQARLAPEGERPSKRRFGFSVALSSDGDTAVIGDQTKKESGAWVFTRTGEAWAQQGLRLASSGESVAVSGEGDEALVGGKHGTVVFVPREATGVAPEFGRCVSQAPGVYTTASCTVATGGGFEWEPGATKPGFTLVGSEGGATFETVHSAKIACTGDSGSGEYAGTKALTGLTLVFTGCDSAGQPCTSEGASSGDIDTGALEATLGVETRAGSAIHFKLALDIAPAAGGETFARFTCGASEDTLRGSVIVPIQDNKMDSGFALKFAATKGKQKPEHLAEAAKDVLEESVAGGHFEQTGLTAKITQTNEEAVEANSVF
jgi:hypothetical protein